MEKVANGQSAVKAGIHPAVRLLLAKHRELTELRRQIQQEIEAVAERIRVVDVEIGN